jgi:cleavage and polyadenylation specificity factor subunit 1
MTGSVGVLIPIEEKIYRRLALLQQIMSMGIATPFAMNPKEYRKIKSKSFRIEKKSGILDGVLLWRYNTLPSSLQDELATIMGVTTDVLLDNLSKIDISANFF